MEASRLRPIIMTSLAFILGVLPLVLTQGAGAEMRRTLGVAVFSGMLGVTFFGIFLTPIFYYVLQSFSEWWNGNVHAGTTGHGGNLEAQQPAATAHEASRTTAAH